MQGPRAIECWRKGGSQTSLYHDCFEVITLPFNRYVLRASSMLGPLYTSQDRQGSCLVRTYILTE